MVLESGNESKFLERLLHLELQVSGLVLCQTVGVLTHLRSRVLLQPLVGVKVGRSILQLAKFVVTDL